MFSCISIPPSRGTTLLNGLRVVRHTLSLVCREPFDFGTTYPSGVIYEALVSQLRQNVPGVYARLLDQSGHECPMLIAPEHPVQTDYHPGEVLTLRLTLLGKAGDHLEALLTALIALEETGFDINREVGQGSFYLSKVVTHTPEGRCYVVYDRGVGPFYDVSVPWTAADATREATRYDPRQVTLDFDRPLVPAVSPYRWPAPAGAQVVRPLAWRLRQMLVRYCGRYADLRPLLTEAAAIETHMDHIAHHAVQPTPGCTPLAALTGRLTLRGSLAPMLPLLVAGQWVHMGRACHLGLGRYRLQTS